ncbi:MAG: tetratricopeptide repeat protein [Casimicrobiaceae bacterium]
MKKYAPGVEASEIRLVNVEESTLDAADPPVDALTAPAAASTPAAAAAAAAESASRYLRRATKEYEAGRIDKSLWKRALAKAGNDQGLAKQIYLQNRAIAIRVARREEKAARYAHVEAALGHGPDTGTPDMPPGATAKVTPKVSGPTSLGGNRNLLIIGVACFLVVVGGLWVLYGGGEPGQSGDAQRAGTGAASFKAARAIEAAAADASTPVTEALAVQNLVGKIRALEKDGNWNLVVLNSVEWTRKQPVNPDAWQGLSQGYLKLRQFSEALEAANRATQLAPEDFRTWQNLGLVYIALERPADALTAFHRATVLNDQDVVSLVQEAKMNAQAGRIVEAKGAYAKALAASPDDAQALCGAASIAHKEGRGKDAEAMMQRLTSRGELCVDPTAGVTVKVEPSAAARKR